MLLRMGGANRVTVGHKVCYCDVGLYYLLSFRITRTSGHCLGIFRDAKMSSTRTAPSLISRNNQMSCPAVHAFFWLSVPLYYSSNAAANRATWTVLTIRYSATCQERVYASFDCHNQRPSLPSTSSTCRSCENAGCFLRATNRF